MFDSVKILNLFAKLVKLSEKKSSIFDKMS